MGTTFRSVERFLGKRMETEWEIIEYEPNRQVVSKGISRPFPIEGRWTYEAVEGGTRVNFVGEAQPSGFFGKLAEPILSRLAQRQYEADYTNLKDLMEAGAL